MSKSIIIFGRLNKKYFLPLLLVICQMIYIIVNAYYPEKENNLVLQEYTLALGEMSIKLLPLILKISNKEIEKEKEIKKRKCLHYFILCILFLFDQGLRVTADLLDHFLLGKDISYTQSNIFLINDFFILSIEMILMVVISIKLLKYKYFIHHVISIIFFIIFGIICDIILNNFDNINKNYFIVKFIRLLNVVVDALYYCYQKYMMEILFYPYWNIAFVPGVFVFCLASGLLLFALIDSKRENSSTPFIASFYSYFVDIDTGIIIGKVLLVLILHVIMCPLSILNVYYFNPSFILIIFQLSSITDSLIKKPAEKSYCIVFYILQFFALMIHLEIIELNFCGLNKNTKRNVELRGILDISKERKDSSVEFNNIDINKDYYIENNVYGSDKTIEMIENSIKNSLDSNSDIGLL